MKVLIVKLSALGDVIQALDLIDCLIDFQTYLGKKVVIDWVIEEQLAPLLEFHPHIRKLVRCPFCRWKKDRWNFALISKFIRSLRCLREVHYDHLFDLQGNLKSSLITFVARARNKAGFAFSCVPEWPASLFLSHRYLISRQLSERERLVQMARLHLNFPQQEARYMEKQSLMPPPSRQEHLFTLSLLTEHSGPRFLVSIGARWPNKQLTLGQWRLFLKEVITITRGRLLFCYGTEQEREGVNRLHASFSSDSLTLPFLIIPLLCRCLEQVEGVICLDSAILHLSARVNTPTFSLFGPSRAQAYRPQESIHGGIEGDCPYGVSFSTRCPSLRSCKSGACLKELALDRLVERFKCWWQVTRSTGSSSSNFD